MEAPVPISAQLHSSTLVIIGFYIYYRFLVFFTTSSDSLLILKFAGSLTVVGASILAFYQTDGKKLLACSTAGQLGYVVISLGLNLVTESLYMLSFCCINKALTFVWFGVIMNKCNGLSDFRFIGSTYKLSRFEQSGLLLSVLNFTIMPGAFSWHVKSLFLQQLTDCSIYEVVPYIILNLT